MPVPIRISHGPLWFATGMTVLVLAFTASASVGHPTGFSFPAAIPPSPDSDSIAAVLPETALDLQRASLQTVAGPLPSGPQPPSALRPLLMFLPEALMEVQTAPDSLSGIRARYEGGPRPMLVGIIDYGTPHPELRAVYRRLAAEGHATETSLSVNGTEFTAYQGTGTSDDVVPPHGIRALVGARFEVVVVERPPEGVSSVADVDALAPETLEEMIERARALLAAIDLRQLTALADHE